MGQTHMPHERFNLFHIDNQEIHFESLNASAFLINDLIDKQDQINNSINEE